MLSMFPIKKQINVRTTRGKEGVGEGVGVGVGVGLGVGVGEGVGVTTKNQT